MNIYEIEQAIMDLVDPETGEIADFEALDALSMARDEKIENVALWTKNLNAEANAIREEEKALAERRRAAETKADSLQRYLDRTLAGERFTTTKVAISYRKSKAVEIADEEAFKKAGAYLVPQDPKIDKKAISEALKNGTVIAGAELVERNNIQIK